MHAQIIDTIEHPPSTAFPWLSPAIAQGGGEPKERPQPDPSTALPKSESQFPKPESQSAPPMEALERQAVDFRLDSESPANDLLRTPDLSEDLLPRVAAGDADAIQACIDRYGALIWSLARRHSPTSVDAEDGVQEIYIDLWKSADRFDGRKASETTFVAMIARRRLIDRHRHRQRRPTSDALDPALEMVSDPQQRQIEASADASLAARALATLAPQEKRVILLSTYQGMSHGQIADHTGIPLGTVKTYIRRGLQRVRELLENPSPTTKGAGR